MISKIARRNKIKTRIRGRISGTAQRPRMSVFRSNKAIYVQLIDDLAGKTLCAADSRVGEKVAQKALELGITEVVFDRNGYLFHGRVKSLADAARKAGLKF